jgi:cytochrome c peroxidase
MKKILILLGFFSIIVFIQSCEKETSSDTTNSVVYDGSLYNLNIGNFPTPNLAEDNQLSQQKVQLGRMLFYEKMLSKDATMSCASCHRQEHAFSDTARFSIGVHGLAGKRQAMAVFNMAWNENQFFWDGRANLLRDQSLKPIQDSLEMAESLANVITKLNASQVYIDQFQRAFSTGEINELNISLALEQFMNSITSVDSKFDRFLNGEATLSPSEARGRLLFFSEYNPFFPNTSGADCAHCHGGPNFENDNYMNNGLQAAGSFTDIGREEVTGLRSDRGKMKVTSLRNIELTAPYMHDGRFNSLEEVIDHYNSGLKNSNSLDPALANTISTGLFLNGQDKADIVAFLKTLTDDILLTKEEYSNPF